MRTALLLAFAVTLSAVAAPVPKGVKKQNDAELMGGRWVSVSFDNGGGPRASESYGLIVHDGKMQLATGRPEVAPEAPFSLDASQSPKHLNVLWKGRTEPERCAYFLDDDALTLCYAQPNNTRPTELKGGPDGQLCFVFKRVKE